VADNPAQTAADIKPPGDLKVFPGATGVRQSAMYVVARRLEGMERYRSRLCGILLQIGNWLVENRQDSSPVAINSATGVFMPREFSYCL
jgi:hypothetical protein